MELQIAGLFRKQAAVQIHEYLHKELGEADETDVRASYTLRDLFDWRVCAGHIMQVYVKGIMEACTAEDGSLIFGTEQEVSGGEAKAIIQRIYQKELRFPKKASEERQVVPVCITEEEALHMLLTEKYPVLVDVRTKREFEEGHVKGAEHIPLMELMKNPYGVSAYRDEPILFYCTKGIQSRVAAQCLLEAGYTKVFHFAWNGQI